MLRASLLLLTSWLQYQELPQLPPLPSLDGVRKSASTAAERTRLPPRAIVSMGPGGLLTGGPYQLMACGSNDDEWVGAWHGAFERRQAGNKLLDMNFERAKAVPARADKRSG